MPSTANNNGELTNQQKLDSLIKAVKSYPDFPKPGILFRDFFPIFRHPHLINNMIDLLAHQIQKSCPQLTGPTAAAGADVDVIIGLESRGFLLGPLVALRLNKPFVPIRKKGKLPGSVMRMSYELEYGGDTFEIQVDSLGGGGKKVVLIDDLLATGGTMKCAVKLIESLNCKVAHALVVIELADLKGREQLPNIHVHSLIKY